jgi:hypothetical protein
MCGCYTYSLFFHSGMPRRYHFPLKRGRVGTRSWACDDGVGLEQRWSLVERWQKRTIPVGWVEACEGGCQAFLSRSNTSGISRHRLVSHSSGLAGLGPVTMDHIKPCKPWTKHQVYRYTTTSPSSFHYMLCSRAGPLPILTPRNGQGEVEHH